jgi:hypothetical protein
MRDGCVGRAIAMAAACAGLACAGGPGGSRPGNTVQDSSRFPTPKELEKLEAAPVPAKLFDLDVRTVDTWELSGPFPERIVSDPYTEPENPWAALVDDAARRRVGLVVPTEAMYCVARELGRFYLAQRGQPTVSLRSYITSRCNASVANVGFQYVEAAVSTERDDVQIYGQWKDPVIEAIRQSLKGGPQTIGIWYGRDDERAVVMVAFCSRELLLEPIATVPAADGTVEVSGEALEPVAEIRGLVNRGRAGFGECEPVGEVALPSFHLRCPVDPKDDSTLISVGLHPPNRLLGTLGLLVLAWPKGHPSAVYRRPVYGERWPMLDEQNLGDGFVELLNRVRHDAGLEPVALDAGQSETATKLAPHFFASVYGGEDELTADLVVLGMIAGWTVDGIVQTGHFSAAWALRTNDLADLLATALELPGGRETLLAGDVQRIAIGPMLRTEKDREWIAAMFGTYSLFSEKAHEKVANRVFEKIAEERRRRGVEPPERLPDLVPLCEVAASAVQGGQDPRDAMNALLQRSVDVLERPVSGWVTEVTDIESLSLPEEYLKRPSLGVAVAVSHRRAKGDAWGRYVVLLVLADPEAEGV